MADDRKDTPYGALHINYEIISNARAVHFLSQVGIEVVDPSRN